MNKEKKSGHLIGDNQNDKMLIEFTFLNFNQWQYIAYFTKR